MFLFFIFFLFIYLFLNLKKWHFNQSAVAKQISFAKMLNAIDFIYSYANKKMFNYYAFTPNLTSKNYEYLFFWHGRNKYGYLLSKEEELFSLIIEPSEFFPETGKFWRNQCYKTYKKSGKIIKVKKFGDITLEARLKQK